MSLNSIGAGPRVAHIQPSLKQPLSWVLPFIRRTLPPAWRPQAASQAEFYQAQAYEARGAAHALHETMIRREHEYVAAANALRHEAEQQVLGAQTQVEDILRDIESRMPAVTQNIRAEVQGQGGHRSACKNMR